MLESERLTMFLVG